MASSAPVRHLVLVGLMATGKSTVGRLVAERLGWAFVDTDDEVETAASRSVRDIWRDEGEEAFRRLESDVLADAVDRGRPSVIAGAGGVVLAAENRAVLHADHVLVVWLRAAPDTLLARVEAVADEHRPLLDGDAAGMLERMFADRSRLYEAVADTIVDVDALSIDQVVTAVSRRLTPGAEA